jgi:hypothetical protein
VALSGPGATIAHADAVRRGGLDYGENVVRLKRGADESLDKYRRRVARAVDPDDPLEAHGDPDRQALG